MLLRDIKKLFSGINSDDDPQFLKEGEYPSAKNIRVASSSDQQGAGIAETLQGEIEILLGVDASMIYYGTAIGGSFLYSGYEEVTIGTQTWMKKNWDVAYPGSKVYNDDEANRGIYGGLYTWNQIMSADFCPEGWHVPTEAEIDVLLTFLGGELLAGGHLKEVGESHWNTPNTGADDSYGFRALPGGRFDTIFELLGTNGLFWLKDEIGDEVVIGTQTWKTANVKNNIAGCHVYDDDEANADIYGRLYTWDMIPAIEAANPGWHVPTEAEWKTLIAFLGGSTWDPIPGGFVNLSSAGLRLKEIGTAHWDVNAGATDDYGFSMRGGGNRFYTVYQELLFYNDLWSKTPFDANNMWYFEFRSIDGTITESYLDLNLWCYVRLIKD